MEVLAQVLFLMFFMNCWNFNKAYTPSGYLGCYIDKIDRILSHRMPNSALNSGDQCKKQCKTSGYRYAGTEYTVECFCGNVIKEYPKGSECTAKCPGNKDEMCGGTWHISLYDTQENDESEDSESLEVYVPSGYLGCYIDKVERILSHRMPNFANNTGDQCKQRCEAAGYRYAGTEYTDQCFCGNNITDYPKGSECTAKCPGNKDEMCGGTWHISLYDTQENDESEDSESLEVYVPSGYLGCYIDKVERILSHRMPNSANNNGDQCKQKCEAAGYRYAGTEYTVECFCGNDIKKYPNGSECNAKCPGNKDEICGGTWHISLYDTQENESEDSDSQESDLNYCEKYDACPPKWKCRNRKRGFLCRAPSSEVKISK
ncbi:uncharacterized protein LOC132732864 [Ruditapes philippinarum]|uniref:uncharacterized protein LOC132732864 n=1 Tax=Ruditapes philippinarum TaxID=129788 RepID=UPI00295A7219|nr:uncharacterized protein LOC132732864 [Ruditapes philippinarum]